MKIGAAGTTIVGITSGQSSPINSTVDIVIQFILPISGFAGWLSIGVISGGLT